MKLKKLAVASILKKKKTFNQPFAPSYSERHKRNICKLICRNCSFTHSHTETIISLTDAKQMVKFSKFGKNLGLAVSKIFSHFLMVIATNIDIFKTGGGT